MSSVPPVEPRRRPTQRRSAETVDAILAATARVLVEEGYDGASTNHIARVAGVSVGSLYQYFPNKQALVLALMRRHSEGMLALLRAHAVDTAGAPIPDVVRGFVRAMIAAHRLDPVLHRVLVPQVMALGMEHIDAFQRPVLAVIGAWLEAHRDQIVPRDLRTAAFVLVASVEATVHAAFLEDPPLDMTVLEHEIADLVLRYLLGDAPARQS